MMFGTVGGDSLAGGDLPQAVRVENLAVVAVDGVPLEAVDGAHLESPGRVEAVDGAHLESPGRVDLVVDTAGEAGKENTTHGVQDHGTGEEEKAERAREERARDRNLNLPRVVDIGFGPVVPPGEDGNLVVVAAGRPLESQASQGLSLADGMERMTMIGQEAIPITSPTNQTMMIGQVVASPFPSPCPSPSLLLPTPLVGKTMDGMPMSTTRLTLKVFVKNVTH